MQELAELTREPPEGMKVVLVDEADVHRWSVLLDGPPESIYSVSYFFSRADIGQRYTSSTRDLVI